MGLPGITGFPGKQGDLGLPGERGSVGKPGAEGKQGTQVGEVLHIHKLWMIQMVCAHHV